MRALEGSGTGDKENGQAARTLRLPVMRDISHDISALTLNTATLGHNLDGHGAGWPPERIIDARARRGLGGIVFWSREIGSRSREIGESVRAAGMAVAGLRRTPFLVGPGAGSDDKVRESIDMAAGQEARVLTVVTVGNEHGSKGLRDSRMRLTEKVAVAAEYAGTMDVRLALEPLPPMFGGNRTVLMTCLNAVHVCEAVNAPNLGIAVDVYHVWWDSMLDSSPPARDVNGSSDSTRATGLRTRGTCCLIGA